MPVNRIVFFSVITTVLVKNVQAVLQACVIQLARFFSPKHSRLLICWETRLDSHHRSRYTTASSVYTVRLSLQQIHNSIISTYCTSLTATDTQQHHQYTLYVSHCNRYTTASSVSWATYCTSLTATDTQQHHQWVELHTVRLSLQQIHNSIISELSYILYVSHCNRHTTASSVSWATYCTSLTATDTQHTPN